MKEWITAAGESHGLETTFDQLVDEVGELGKRDRFFGPKVLLVAEIAGHIAAVREVELRMHRTLRGPIGGDGLDDLALPLPRGSVREALTFE